MGVACGVAVLPLPSTTPSRRRDPAALSAPGCPGRGGGSSAGAASSAPGGRGPSRAGRALRARPGSVGAGCEDTPLCPGAAGCRFPWLSGGGKVGEGSRRASLQPAGALPGSRGAALPAVRLLGRRVAAPVLRAGET